MTAKLFEIIGSFNSRSREGSDRNHSRRLGRFYVSIHAPVKGATSA